MGGSRRILVITEDPVSLDTEEDDGSQTNVYLYCRLLSYFCGIITNQNRENTCRFLNNQQILADSLFFALVHPNARQVTRWISPMNIQIFDTLKSECEQRMSECERAIKGEPVPVNYRSVYNALIELKSSIMKTDILDVIWVVPNMEKMHSSQMAIQADATKAAYLYQAFHAIEQSNPSLQFTILASHSCEELLVWSSLLHSTIYWVTPSFLFPPTNVLEASDLSEKRTPNVDAPSMMDSFIIEDSIEDSIELKKQPESYSKKPLLPLIQFSEAFELNLQEFEMVCTRLIAQGIKGRCQIEWCEQDHQFVNEDVFSLMFPSEPVVSFQHYACNMGIVQNQKGSMISLSPNHPIQIVSQMNPVEMACTLHTVMEQSESISLIASHPQKNLLVSHIQKMGERSIFFGCSAVCELANRSKLVCLPSILVCSEFSFSLFVNYEEQLSTPSYLGSVMSTALNHPVYHMILDSDLPLLDSTNLENEPMDGAIENEAMNEIIPNASMNENYDSNAFRLSPFCFPPK